MRVAMRVLWVLLLLIELSFGAQEGSRRVVLDAASIGQPALEKTVSTTSQTGFSFRMAGVELSDKAVSTSTYQEVSAITNTPEKFGETDEDGLPNLPVYAQLVAIPDEAGVRAEIISSSYQIIDEVDVYPCQPSPIEEQSEEAIPFTKNEAFYRQDQFYPSDVVSLGEPTICRDLRMIQAVINPIQYNPVRRQLKVYTNVDYRLNYEGIDTRNVKVRRDNHISETFLSLYRSLAPNADEMLAGYEPIRGGYLILYPHTFPDSLVQLLARWKHLKGYSVVATSDTAITHTANSPDAAQVFSYVQTAYNTWAVPPEFVCIMGRISSGIAKIPDSPFGGASDHDYSCVDGTDYLSDIMVTRMIVQTSNTPIRTTIYKDLIYEKTPYMGGTDPNYWLRALSCAGNVTNGSAPTRSPRLNVLWVREQLMRHGYIGVDTVFAWQSYDPGIGGILASLGNGVSLVSYRGWGFPTYWGYPVFTTSNLDEVAFNNKMSVQASLTCGTGTFSVDDCFGEHWITMGSLAPGSGLKGGPGFYGCSEEGTHTRYMNPLMIGYYWAILEEGIYNFASAAFMAKMELYNTFPRTRGSGSLVERYFHTFNTLGDPELEVRTSIPQAMTVTYPSSIPVGTSMLTIHVVGSGASPLEGAYGNLVKGRTPEEVFVGGRTNAAGDITLNFSTALADTMFVTVTARNYIPHLGQTLVQTQPVAVNVGSIVLDDDNSGNSHGNGDGNANPSETVELAVILRNFGNTTTATNVSATLSSPDPDIFITIPTQSYGSIIPGGTATSGKFAILLSPNIPHGEHYILQLGITSDQGSWIAAVPVDIKNMLFSNRGLSYPGNSNNRLDPGETSQLVISVQNLGQLAGNTLSGVLTTSDTAIVILDGTADFGNIAIGATDSNSASPFSIQARANVYHGYNSNFNLELTSSNGSVADMPLSLVVGNVNTFDPIGPDSYGYYLYDNTDGSYQACPIYNWVEISPFAGGSGTRVTFPFETDDDAVVINNLPFGLRYYGQSYNYLLVSINGFIAFDTTRYDMQGHHWSSFDNNQLPEPGAPDGIIAPFWDDLEYTGNNGVFKYSDTINHRFIIEWKACTHPNAPGNHPETFQIIIYDPAFYPTPTGDAEIVFQYQVVYNDDTDTWDPDNPGLYSTIGMQNPSNNNGLQYTFDNFFHPAAAPLVAGRAIKLTTIVGLQEPPDIAYDPSSFIKTGQVGQVVHDTLTISNVSGGLLSFTLNEYTDYGRLADNGNGILSNKNELKPIGYTEIDNAKTGDERQPIYPPSLLSRGGPDAYGNVWVDSDNPGAPAYNWVDISGIGTPVTFTLDDQFVGPIDMGMNFSFYGNTYSSVYICSNGFLSFAADTAAFGNRAMPTADPPNNLIAMVWDDLSPERHGSVRYYHDTANGRFIVSFTNIEFFSGGGDLNFEAILYPSGQIFLEYGTVDGGTRGLNSCSIGIENSTGTDGLQVVYNANYLHSNLGISFYIPANWLILNLHSGFLVAGHDTSAVINFDATNLNPGTYTGHLDLDSSDPDESSIDIPVSFTVGSGGTPNIVQTPASFSDTLQVGQSAPFNIKVKNTGTAPLTVAFSSVSSWISTVAGPYAIPVGDSLFHSVTLSAVGLSPGVFNGSVITTTNDPVHPTVTLPVQLRVTALPPPNITFRPSAINDTLSQGASINLDLIVKNTGGSPLNLALSAVEGSLLLAGNGAGGEEHILNNWLFITPAADTLVPNDSLIAEMTLAANIVAPGSYSGHIALVSNDPDTPNATVPVTLLVQSTGPDCHYTVGDANGNGVFNGLDVTYSVSYFKGGPPPPYSCACGSHGTFYVGGDVNASCSFNGLDVTYMVAYFKGGPGARPCSDCPPTVLLDGFNGQHPVESGQ